MAIAIRGLASDGGDPWDGVLDVSGIGIQEGDLLIAINAEGEQHGTGGVWPYDGWTAFTNGWAPSYSDVVAGAEAMYRTAPASPPSSYTFDSHAATPGSVVLIALYSDAGRTLAVDDTNGNWPAELQEPPWDWDAPSATAAASALTSWLVCAWASTKVGAANAITEDAAMTQRHQNTGSGDAPSLTLATEAVSAGATGTRTATAADATAAWQAFSLVVSEYTSPPPPPPEPTIATKTEPLGDYALTFADGHADLSIGADSDDLESDRGLRTAVAVSLFTDRRAEPDDTIPADDGDRRGWWGDALMKHPGDRMGSRLWTLKREKATPETAARAGLYAEEALAWMVEDQAASRVRGTGFVSGDRLGLLVEIWRPDETDPVHFRFPHIWEAEQERSDKEFPPPPPSGPPPITLQSVLFERANQESIYMADSALLSPSTKLSLEIWVKWATVPSAPYEGNLICKFDSVAGSDVSFRWWTYKSGSLLRMYFMASATGSTSANYGYVDLPYPSAGTWYHYAVTCDTTLGSPDDCIKFYVDGVDQGAVSESTAAAYSIFWDGGDAVEVGNRSVASSGAYYIDAHVAEVRLWKSIRTSAEISAWKDTNVWETDADLMAYIHPVGGVIADVGPGAHPILLRNTPTVAADAPW